jgi:hypothetical protein
MGSGSYLSAFSKGCGQVFAGVARGELSTACHFRSQSEAFLRIALADALGMW